MKLLFFTFTLCCISLPLLYSMTPDEQLIEAAKTGNIQQAQEALTAGAHVNAQTYGGHTPLYRAIGRRKADIVKFLLDAGADINTQDCAYAYIVVSDYYDYYDKRNDCLRIEILLKKCLKLIEEIKSRPAKKLLTQAIDLGYVHAVKLLLQADIKPDLKDLALAKQKYIETHNFDAKLQQIYKDSYATIGRMLLQHLRLTGELQANNLDIPQKSTTLAQWYRWIMNLFWPFGNTTEYVYGPISQSGLGLPKDIAHTIASYTH